MCSTARDTLRTLHHIRTRTFAGVRPCYRIRRLSRRVACRRVACGHFRLPGFGFRSARARRVIRRRPPPRKRSITLPVAMRFFLSPRVLLRGSLARKLSAVVALLRTPATPHRIVDAIPCAPAPYYGPRRPRRPRPVPAGAPASTCLRAPNAAQRHSRGCGAT